MKLRTTACALAMGAAAAMAAPAGAAGRPFLDRLHTIRTLASAVPRSGPAKGDVRPVRGGRRPAQHWQADPGRHAGQQLQQRQERAGDRIEHHGGVAVGHGAPCSRSSRGRPGPPAVGLTTALVELRSGFVIVGSLPAPGGKSSNARAGALTILDAHGTGRRDLHGADINGPWDMTAVDHGKHATLFVTNVLNGTVAANGKVVAPRDRRPARASASRRATPRCVTTNTVIATGFAEHTDPNALIVGPTGVGLGAGGTLYVADSNGNRIAAVPNALTRINAHRRRRHDRVEGRQAQRPARPDDRARRRHPDRQRRRRQLRRDLARAAIRSRSSS